MTREQQKEIRRLRALGEGYKKIGAALNLSVNTVKSFCRRNNGETESIVETMIDTVHPNDDLHCLRCQVPIRQIEGRRARVFCSDACRVAYWRMQAMPSAKRICPGCGALLLGNDRNRKYCSHDCYIRYRFGSEIAGGTNGRSTA